MAATTVKTEPIQNDKTKFRTQIINGKPQIFFDTSDDSSKTIKTKRNSRTLNVTNRFSEQQKSKTNNQKSSIQNETNKPKTAKSMQPHNELKSNENDSSLGVYMTMDELAELVKAVKENAKNENNISTQTKPIVDHSAPAPPPRSETITDVPIVPKLDLPIDSAPPPVPPAQISPREQTLSIMAEKKRQKWLREKAEIEQMQLQIEYDQLKHQLSPRHKQKSVSPERSTFQYDFPQQTTKPLIKQNDVSPKVNEISNYDALKTRLIEKKQEQWQRENAEKSIVWDPFGRPGGGAPKGNENQSRPSQQLPSYRPPISQTPQNFSSTSSQNQVHSDQTRYPAAMRTNLLFGDVRFDEDVKSAKEIERRQWLEDLQKQVDDNNKRRNFIPKTAERREDFLQENVQPIVQQAENRYQQQKETSMINNNGFNQRYSSLQQTYDKTHDTDIESKGSSSKNQNTGEKIFGPNYDSQSRLNINTDRQQAYRPTDTRRNDAVNTVDSTFRSDHNGQTDYRTGPHRQPFSNTYDQSDLPPQVPNHQYQRSSSNKNIPFQAHKRNSRSRPSNDNFSSRRTSTTTYHSHLNDDGNVSQMSSHQDNHGPIDIKNRPLWNYKNPAHREYVPNSKRDPHYEKRQRLKHFQEGNFDHFDDVQKKTCYNRWNSDGDIQQQKKTVLPNRVRSTVTKASTYGNKDESILNLLKIPNRQQQEMFGTRKPTRNYSRTENEIHHNRASSMERYENPPQQTEIDEINDSERVYTPVDRSRETTPHFKQTNDTSLTDNFQQQQQQQWNNSNQQNVYVQPTQNNATTRQEHILQQLSTIRENIVRRQRELASPMSVVPV